MQSDTTLAGSEASTSVFVPVAGYTKTSAAREPSTHMFGQSATGAANTSLHHEGASSGSVKPEHDLAISVEDSAQVSSTNHSSASHHDAFQSTLQQPSGTTASAVSWPAAAVVQMEDAHAASATESKRPLSSHPPGSVCRHDLSGAAMMMRAALLTETSATLATPPETDAHVQQPPPKRQKKVFVHGNYSSYYGYRLGTKLAEDPRLQVGFPEHLCSCLSCMLQVPLLHLDLVLVLSCYSSSCGSSAACNDLVTGTTMRNYK